MRFKGLDLNLLVKFNALMTMRSVSCPALSGSISARPL